MNLQQSLDMISEFTAEGYLCQPTTLLLNISIMNKDKDDLSEDKIGSLLHK